jgi:hypothetical protein
MTRIRTKKAYRRTKKYKKKLITRIINLIFKENVQFYSVDLRDYLRLDNLLERETLDLLNKNVQLGLIKPEEKDLYLAFWREVRELGQRFTDKTLESRIEEKLNEFITRGLKEEKLEEIIDLVKDQLPRKKIFERTKEWSTIVDYLKVKAFSTIVPITKQLIELLPTPTIKFIYSISPIPTRLIKLLPKIRPQLSYSILPIFFRIIELNLVDKVSLQFSYSKIIPLEFRKFLYPKTILNFDYEVISPLFQRFTNTINVGYEYTYTINAITTRYLIIERFLKTVFSYWVSALPTRYIQIKPSILLNFIERVYPSPQKITEITVTTKLTYSYGTYPNPQSTNTLNVKVGTQFSYNIG